MSQQKIITASSSSGIIILRKATIKDMKGPIALKEYLALKEVV
jgi:hypothetical protein